ncbi:DUF1824 family protein [Oscillatoria sp. FACHB-1406]|uniref:DUF1824 family protein n=1 Tax=Oscillatoria sp. FACHB-1406 TaxID=2692846 RepID=UPI001689F8A7|nr:DUF1824 family protein [Oscillatoria sp. FACHB-1406]MBD2579441.1 DUF1824 family protein [Oscillatoria sp. FACHB-1406]
MTSLTITEARKILNAFSCTTPRAIASPVEKGQVREALLAIARASDAENLGVCANCAEEGFAALNRYLSAMGYRANLAEAEAAEGLEPIYIKYNTQKQSCYCDRYTGTYRGVLVSCQSDDDNINGTFGHFPLDLFGE